MGIDGNRVIKEIRVGLATMLINTPVDYWINRYICATSRNIKYDRLQGLARLTQVAVT